MFQPFISKIAKWLAVDLTSIYHDSIAGFFAIRRSMFENAVERLVPTEVKVGSFRLGGLAQPIQYLLIGATGMIVDLLVFATFMVYLPSSAARALSIWVAMTWNFVLNRQLTFGNERRRPAAVQYFLFCSACLVGAAVNWSLFTYLYSDIAYFRDHPFAAAFIGIACGTVFNYLISKFIVFN